MHCLYNKIMNFCMHVFYHQIKGGATDNVITEEGVAGLDLLIGGSADKKGVCSVLSLATMKSEMCKAGCSKVSI